VTRAGRIQDIVSYEKKEQTLALLKILALANRNIEQGRYRPAKGAFATCVNGSPPARPPSDKVYRRH